MLSARKPDFFRNLARIVCTQRREQKLQRDAAELELRQLQARLWRLQMLDVFVKDSQNVPGCGVRSETV